MYAVIQSGGRQVKVGPGMVVAVDRVAGISAGDRSDSSIRSS